MIRILALIMLLGAATAAAPSESPDAANDGLVRAASNQLFTTFYRKLDPSSIVDVERTALASLAPRVKLPAVARSLSAKDAPDAAVDEVDAVFERTTLPHDRVVAVALKAMTAATHDRYTTYFTAREYRNFDEALDPTKLSGIGVLLDTDATTKFVRAFFVVPETPADRAGLHSGDLITTIDGKSTRGWSIAQTRGHLLGKTGTPVHLAFEHPGDAKPDDVTIVREDVKPPTVYFTMLPNHIGYIYVAAFGDATPHEFRLALQRSETAGARAYVLDLRNDGGGIVGTALAISSSFVQSGPLVSIESNGGEIQTYEADDSAIDPKPLAVLVNGYSASASEITAAALSESGAGVLIGTKTFGKGVVQTVQRFSDGSAIKITTGRYFTPLNHDINGKGITPGIVVKEDPKSVFGTPEKDAQLRKAIDVLDKQLAENPGIVHT